MRILSLVCAAAVAALANESAGAFAQPKFVPDISLITDVSYVKYSIEEEKREPLEIPGVAHGHSHGEEGHAHAELNGNDGFNLNYAELGIAGAVDPYFDMTGIFHLSEESFEIEEAYVTTRQLPAGLQARVGKFKSRFGRLNEMHHHYWDFADQPLVYGAFFGEHGLNEKGARLTWLPPAPHYIELGLELLQGENENSFGAGEASLGDYEIEPASGAGLTVATLKGGWDLGNFAFLGGLSYAAGKSRIDHSDDEEGPHLFEGDTSVAGADLTVKYPFTSYTGLTWQSEYLARTMDGEKYTETASASMKKEQAGFYTQLVWGFHRNWRTGVRYDAFTQNDVTVAGTKADLPDDFTATALMVEYNPTEFSRLRFQVTSDDAHYVEDEKESYTKAILQFNMTIGAHGAHSF